MRKSLLTIVICLISAMLFAGCGGSEAPAPTDVAQEAVQETAQDQVTPTETPVMKAPGTRLSRSISDM